MVSKTDFQIMAVIMNSIIKGTATDEQVKEFAEFTGLPVDKVFKDRDEARETKNAAA